MLREIMRGRAMNQLREARQRIEKDHPELLDAVRKSIEKSEKSVFHPRNVEALSVPGAAQKSEKPAVSAVLEGEERIDREKNLEAVLKFMKLKPPSVAMKKALEEMFRRK